MFLEQQQVLGTNQGLGHPDEDDAVFLLSRQQGRQVLKTVARAAIKLFLGDL